MTSNASVRCIRVQKWMHVRVEPMPGGRAHAMQLSGRGPAAALWDIKVRFVAYGYTKYMLKSVQGRDSLSQVFME